jgi:hypothetical protein
MTFDAFGHPPTERGLPAFAARQSAASARRRQSAGSRSGRGLPYFLRRIRTGSRSCGINPAPRSERGLQSAGVLLREATLEIYEVIFAVLRFLRDESRALA